MCLGTDIPSSRRLEWRYINSSVTSKSMYVEAESLRAAWFQITRLALEAATELDLQEGAALH